MPRPLTPKGIEMLESIPVRFREDPDVEAVMHAHGRAAERFMERRDAVMLGVASPAGADDAILRLWERLLGLAVAPEFVTIEQRQEIASAYLSALRQAGTGAWWEETVAKIVAAGEGNHLLSGGFDDLPLVDLIPRDDGTGTFVGPAGIPWAPNTDGMDGNFDVCAIVASSGSWQDTPSQALRVATSANGGIYVLQTVQGVGPAADYRVKMNVKINDVSGGGRIHVKLTWYNAADASISTVDLPYLDTVGEFAYSQLVTAPAGADHVRFYVHMNDGLPGSLDVLVDDCFIGPEGPWSYEEFVPVELRTVNLISDPRATSTSNMSVFASGGSTTQAAVTDVDLRGKGTRITTAGGATGFVTRSSTAAVDGPIAPGDYVAFRGRLKLLDDVVATGPMSLSIAARNASGGYVTSLGGGGTAAHEPVGGGFAAGVYDFEGVAFVDPDVASTAEMAGMTFDVGETDGTSFRAVVGMYLAVVVEGPDSPVPDYFDGALGGDGEWLGTADASQSRALSPDASHVAVHLPFAAGTPELGRSQKLIERVTDAHLVLDFSTAGT